MRCASRASGGRVGQASRLGNRRCRSGNVVTCVVPGPARSCAHAENSAALGSLRRPRGRQGPRRTGADTEARAARVPRRAQNGTGLRPAGGSRVTCRWLNGVAAASIRPRSRREDSSIVCAKPRLSAPAPRCGSGSVSAACGKRRSPCTLVTRSAAAATCRRGSPRRDRRGARRSSDSGSSSTDDRSSRSCARFAIAEEPSPCSSSPTRDLADAGPGTRDPHPSRTSPETTEAPRSRCFDTRLRRRFHTPTDRSCASIMVV